MRLPYPVQGLSEATSLTDQPVTTTREHRNCRVVDPRTRTPRGAQRPGLTKVTTTEVSPFTIQRMAEVTYDKKRLTYSAFDAGGVEVEWAKILPLGYESKVGTVDKQGNLYALVGKHGLIRYNSKGAETLRFTFPVEDDDNVVGAIFVDEGLNVYAAVSSGGDQTKAKLWKFYFSQYTGELELAWTLDMESYVPRMIVQGSTLYVIQNRTTNELAELIAFTGIESSTPQPSWIRPVPYPVNDLAVREDGACFVTSGANARRGLDPTVSTTAPRAADWTPHDLVAKERRIWAWYDATSLLGAGREDGDEILMWNDLSGNGRHFRTTTGSDGPYFAEKGLAGLPALRFEGSNRLVTGINLSTDAAKKGEQRTMMPGYTGSAFAVFCVIRPDTDTVRTAVFSQANTVATPFDRVLIANGQSGASGGAAPSFLSGGVHWNDRGNGVAPTPGGGDSGDGFDQPLSGEFDNGQNVAVVTMICDGAVTSGVANAIHSQVRVNGWPLDVYTSRPNTCSGTGNVSMLGGDVGATLAGYKGLICEILVLDLYNAATFGGANGNSIDIVEVPTQTAGDLSTAYPNGTYRAANDTEVERIEGYLAWKWGVANMLDDGANGGWAAGGASSNGFIHPFTYDSVAAFRGPPDPDGFSLVTPSNEKALLSLEPVLAKFSGSTGKPVWVVEGTNVGGVGYGVSVMPNNKVVTMGPQNGSDTTIVRITLDEGDSQSGATPIGGIATIGGAIDWEHETPRIATDKFGNAYIPYFDQDTTNVFGAKSFILDNDQTGVVYTYPLPGANGTYQTLIPPTTPEYEDDIDPKRAQYVYLLTRGSERATLTATGNPAALDTVTIGANTYTFVTSIGAAANQVLIGINESVTLDNLKAAINLEAGSGTLYSAATVIHPTARATTKLPRVLTVASISIGGALLATTETSTVLSWNAATMTAYNDSVHKIKLVDSTPIDDVPRTVVDVAVSGGALYSFDSTGSTLISGGGLSHLAPYVGAATLFSKMYLTDGRTYLQYDPKAGTLGRWEATSAGEIPERCPLIAAWRGRMVLARSPDDPHLWHMSKQGDPLDWDFFPPVVTSAQAVSGNNALIGRAAQPINSLFAYDDDLLLVGCTHSLWRMTGDPMAGGQLDLVSDVTGTAFGSVWAKDERGVCYFVGNSGEVFAMAPGGVPVPIGENKAENLLRGALLGSSNPELVWDDAFDALHLFYMPTPSTGGSTRTHLTWERRVDAWSTVSYASADVEPTAAMVRDGDDPGDRAVLLAGGDRIIRKMDPAAWTDDGQPIRSSVLLGPYADTDWQMRWTSLRATLDPNYGGVRYELYVSDEPVLPDRPVADGEFRAGRNDRHGVRAKGSYFWVRLLGVGRHWALETLEADTVAAGRKRSTW